MFFVKNISIHIMPLGIVEPPWTSKFHDGWGDGDGMRLERN